MGACVHVYLCMCMCMCVCLRRDGSPFVLFFDLFFSLLLFALHFSSLFSFSLSPLLTLPVFSTFSFLSVSPFSLVLLSFFPSFFSLCSCTQKQPFSPTLPLVLPTLPPFTHLSSRCTFHTLLLVFSPPPGIKNIIHIFIFHPFHPTDVHPSPYMQNTLSSSITSSATLIHVRFFLFSFSFVSPLSLFLPFYFSP